MENINPILNPIGSSAIITCSRCGKRKKRVEFAKKLTRNNTHGLCKKCKSKGDSKYRQSNKEKIAIHSARRWREDGSIRDKNKLYKELRRTGINATEFVKDKKCEMCGMANEQHKQMYNERLHVHHGENTGRKNIRLHKEPVHNDLHVLCRSCHVTTDNKKRNEYAKCEI